MAITVLALDDVDTASIQAQQPLERRVCQSQLPDIRPSDRQTVRKPLHLTCGVCYI